MGSKTKLMRVSESFHRQVENIKREESFLRNTDLTMIDIADMLLERWRESQEVVTSN